jgi:hypothetical protein
MAKKFSGELYLFSISMSRGVRKPLFTPPPVMVLAGLGVGKVEIDVVLVVEPRGDLVAE